MPFRHRPQFVVMVASIEPNAWDPRMTVVDQLAALPTPALLLDERRMLANIARMRERAAGLGVRLRPHLKTAKSVDVARRLLDGGAGAATVSTLREAEVFFQAGVRDLLYAVGIAPQKLPQVAALHEAGRQTTARQVVRDEAAPAPLVLQLVENILSIAAVAIELAKAFQSLAERGRENLIFPHLLARADVEEGEPRRSILVHRGRRQRAFPAPRRRRRRAVGRRSARRCCSRVRKAR